jgi:hypothetical protein
MSIPIRMAIRITFDDGIEHDYEVRSPAGVDAPISAFWPEGVVTPDVAKRMEYDQERQREIDALRAALGKADAELAQVDQILREHGFEDPPGARGVQDMAAQCSHMAGELHRLDPDHWAGR